MKTCHECKIEKEIKLFNKNSSRKDGLQSRCRDCDRLRAKKNYDNDPLGAQKAINRKIKRMEINKIKVYEILLNTECKKCKEKDPIVLDFDHLKREEKIDTISQMVLRRLILEQNSKRNR